MVQTLSDWVLSPETTSQKLFSRNPIVSGGAGIGKSTLVTGAIAFSDDLRLEQARDLYLSRNGFNLQEYNAPTFTIGIFGVQFRFPNTAGRKSVIPFHDLHHVLTGYTTDWLGEAEIGAWELRAGCRTLIAYFLNGSGVIIGLLLSPRRVWRAFRSAKGQRTLYCDPMPYERLLQMTVGEVRARVGLSRRS